MRKINQTIANKYRCPSCGARGRIGYYDHTCDGVCHRAHVRGISRGLQIELEARRDNKRPYPVDAPPIVTSDELSGYEFTALEFEQRFASLFDNSLSVRV